MTSLLRPTLSLVVGLTLVLGLVMPLLFVALGQVAFPLQANGSLISRDGHAVGSALIGQDFTAARYFHGRVSSLTGTDGKGRTVATPYDASESGASNLAPTSAALLARVEGDLGAFGGTDVPGDAVTSSGSGLDPDISPANAARQAGRVAQARHVAVERVAALVARHTQGRLLGVFGEPRVNVLRLNLALDAGLPGR